MNWPDKVIIKEVGPRDGLQNEQTFIQTKDKISWINLLSQSGLKYIEITSFVNPKWIPALADSLEVAKSIEHAPGVTYTALVPNPQGLERALMANIDEVAVFISSSETHNQKNINKSIKETFPILKKVVQDGIVAGKSIRGYVSTVFGCPYEGEISIEKVIRVAERLFEIGVNELSLGDTIGIASPKQVQALLEKLLKRYPAEKLAMHFHDTHGTALANILVSLDMGITRFDSSVGGLGGCPYAPGASGNVATEDILYMLNNMGIYTGINEEKLISAAKFIEKKIGRPLFSHNLKAYSCHSSGLTTFVNKKGEQHG